MRSARTLWSDDSQIQCPHTVNGDWGTGNGWCSSDLDELIGSTSDASACWTMCKNTYGSDLVAIDWTPDGECYCQDDCQCMEDMEDGDIHLITSSAVASLPTECVSACPAEEAAFEDCLSQQGSLDDDGSFLATMTTTTLRRAVSWVLRSVKNAWRLPGGGARLSR